MTEKKTISNANFQTLLYVAGILMDTSIQAVISQSLQKVLYPGISQYDRTVLINPVSTNAQWEIISNDNANFAGNSTELLQHRESSIIYLMLTK